MNVGFKSFESGFDSWDTPYSKATAFIATLSREQLITVTTSENRSRVGIVTVWYWLKAER